VVEQGPHLRNFDSKDCESPSVRQHIELEKYNQHRSLDQRDPGVGRSRQARAIGVSESSMTMWYWEISFVDVARRSDSTYSESFAEKCENWTTGDSRAGTMVIRLEHVESAACSCMVFQFTFNLGNPPFAASNSKARSFASSATEASNGNREVL
jgi:hypothetical protein